MADNKTPVEKKGPGPELRQAREAAGRSLGELAAEMHIGVAHLEAIESNDFDSLGGRPYVKSYIRAYARSLELDPEPYLKAYEDLGLQGHQWRASDRLDDMDDSRQGVVFGMGLVAAALLIAAFFWLMSDNKAPDTGALQLQSGLSSPSADSGTAGQADEGLPSGNFGVAAANGWVNEPEAKAAEETTDSDSALAADSTASNAAADTEAAEATTDTADDAAESVAAETAADRGNSDTTEAAAAAATEAEAATTADAGSETPASKPAAEPLASVRKSSSGSGPDKIQLEFGSNSWVEIQDGSGNQLVRGLAKKGEQRTYSGTAPFQVFLGNAPDVAITFNGEAFATDAYVKSNNTARFALVKP